MSKHPFLKVVVLFCLIGFSLSRALYSEQKVKILKKEAELKTLSQVKNPMIATLPLGGEYSIAEKISEEWITIALPADNDGIVQSGYVPVFFVGFINVPEGPIGSKDTKLVKENGLRAINPNVPDDLEFLNWQKEYSAAKSRKSLWTGVAIVGGATLVGGIVLYFATGAAGPGTEIQQNLALIVGGLGLSMSLVGISVGVAATQDVRTLESEGKTKGYLEIKAGILPKYRSVGVQLAFGF